MEITKTSPQIRVREKETKLVYLFLGIQMQTSVKIIFKVSINLSNYTNDLINLMIQSFIMDFKH